MEECGRGAAVEQLTARGMLSIPAMGAIVEGIDRKILTAVSIPAMGGNRSLRRVKKDIARINPRDGGQ